MNKDTGIKLRIAPEQLNNVKPYDLGFVGLALALTLIVWMTGAIDEGIRLISNHFSRALIITFGNNFPIFQVSEEGNTLSLSLALAIIALWIGAIIFHILHRRNVILAFALGIISFAIAIIIEEYQLFLAVGLTFMIIGLWAGKKVTLRRIAFTATFIITFAIIAISVTDCSSFTTLDSLRYGKGAMNQGNIIEAEQFDKSKDIKLTVKMNKPQSVYLRGYVGEAFDQGHWKQLDGHRKAQYSNQFLWIHSQEYYGTNQLAKASMTIDKEETKENNTITVDNIDESSKYCFVPYEYVGNDQLDDKMSIGDANIVSKGIFGNRQYTYQATPNVVKRYPQILEGLKEVKANQLLENQALVNYFAYKEYLNLTRDEKETIESVLGEYSLGTKEKHLDYGQAKGKILDYLSKHIKYTEEAQSYTTNFLEEFLQVDCKGYSIHFATAATLMFRYYGIPARYVEGYIITPEEKAKSLNLSAANSHAWVEYYQDGIGWIPYEVTTPYIGKMEQAKAIKSVPKEKDNVEKEKPHKKKNKDDTIKRNKDNQQTSEGIWWLLPLIAIIILVAGYWFIRKMIISRRLKDIFQNDANITIMKLHGYYQHVIKTLNLSSINFEDEAFEYSLYQEARYSNHILTSHQVDMEEQIISAWLHKTYLSLNTCKKLLWKYILFIDLLEKKYEKDKK